MDEYLPMFLAEGREHLQELNLAVVQIEETPDDQATVDEIFRIAHSLKGMSATMGFANMAALTHEMEDVFELLRQRTTGLPRVAVDVLFQCLDALSAAVESIDETGAENIQPQALIESLRGLVRERTPEQEAERAGLAIPPSDELSALADGRRVIQISARLDEDVSMAAVRAYMVLSVIAGYGETLRCSPTPEDVDTFDGREIDAWVVSERTDTEIQDAVASVPEVAEVQVFEAVPDAALEAPDEVEQEVTAPVPPPVEALATDTPAGEAPEPVAPASAAPAPAPVAEKPKEKATANKQHGGSSTVRVDAERLDQLMHFMGELVLHRTQVEALIQQADVPGLSQAMQNLTRTSHALQSMVMQVRMIPVEAVFLRFPRLVRDLSTKLGKQVDLQLVGKDTELDRTVVDALGDPLVHLVRNSLDHGLEGPEERVAAGKPATGTLEISARHAGGNVIITVADDGRGINARKVAEKAAERGLIDPASVDSIDMARAVELLFTPGFSTAEVTSDISGRGVGMDAVRAAIRGLGGEVIMTSEPGKGTSSQIRLPLTLAIMAALIVEADNRPFAIPLDRIERTVRVADQAVRSVAGRRMLVLSDGVLPIVDASSHYGGPTNPEAEYAVVVRGNGDRFALTVSRMIGQHELVTRPLPPEISDGAALSGAAVLSDGQIALIVDCDAVVDVPVSA
ncbi:chemotaxis protein CheA [Solirubrobacter sp. CPCC 204708]|uniref:Chemotaxis protein CheA n=1 Tax=Solirubrobacter deserti TaxID=2282478 RepID=A0ABT4RH30_9ACTN|nr:chemotaxis protein CheA [Solirubrobacter deserti]MBE2315333.1 chemotaxis protein CheA [Solirubrobacter deserti]MDA0137822.1 chemotaxis protein CheA [Solirubrobacter deserti]